MIFIGRTTKQMYSTKLTVSHSMCSELTPPKISQLCCLLSIFSLHSKSFTSDQSSQKYIVRILLYLLCTTKHVYPRPSPANSRLDFNVKNQRKQGNQKRNGDFRRRGLLLLFCQSGNNLKMINHNARLHSVQRVYKKMPCMKNTLFG